MNNTSASEVGGVRKWRAAIFTLCLVLAGSFAVFGQTATPEQTVKSFYKWYVHSLNASDKGPSNAQIRPRISARLAKWMTTKEYAEWDADYFLSAQDWGHEWGDHVEVSNVVETGNTATLHVKLIQPPDANGTGMGDWELDLKLVKEAGGWKIDKVTHKE